MHKYLRALFTVIFILSFYHLVRDILQILGLNNGFTNILHRPHIWCGPFCNTITIPLVLIGVVGSFIVLKRKRLGSLGIIVLASLPLWLLAILLP